MTIDQTDIEKQLGEAISKAKDDISNHSKTTMETVKSKFKQHKQKHLDQLLELIITAYETLIGAIQDTELKTLHIKNTCVVYEVRTGVKYYLANHPEDMQKYLPST